MHAIVAHRALPTQVKAVAEAICSVRLSLHLAICACSDCVWRRRRRRRPQSASEHEGLGARGWRGPHLRAGPHHHARSASVAAVLDDIVMLARLLSARAGAALAASLPADLLRGVCAALSATVADAHDIDLLSGFRKAVR